MIQLYITSGFYSQGQEIIPVALHLEDGFFVSPLFALVDDEGGFRSRLSSVLQNVEEIDSILGKTSLSSVKPALVQFLCHEYGILDLNENC